MTPRQEAGAFIPSVGSILKHLSSGHQEGAYTLALLLLGAFILNFIIR